MRIAISAVLTCAAAALVVAQSGSARAQEALPFRAEMTPGLVKLFRAERPISNVVVGKKEVADVVALGDRTIAVTAHGVGSTTLIFIDEENQTIAATDVTVIPEERAGRDVITVRAHSESQAQKLEYLCDTDGECIPASTNTPQQPPQSPITINLGPAAPPAEVSLPARMPSADPSSP